MKKKLFRRGGIAVMAFVMPLMMLTSCGKKSEDSPESASEAATTAETDPEVLKAKAFAGEWRDEDDNAILDIWVDSEAVCHGEIIVTHSENELTFWYFTGTVVGEELVYLDCERVDAHYDDMGEVNDESIYTRGRGNIGFSGKYIFWNDSKDDAGAGMVFEYYGEY
jgi:hypothetical protein